jgi:hypothetical protein
VPLVHGRTALHGQCGLFFARPPAACSRPHCPPWPRRPVFCAASCRGPVLGIGAISAERTVIHVLAAGSVVSCDFAPSSAGAS